MTYSEVRQIIKKFKPRYYVDGEGRYTIDSQISKAFRDKNNIAPVTIVMLDANNPIRELASIISDEEGVIVEIMETIIMDIIIYYKEDLDIQYVYDSIVEIDSIINDREFTIDKTDIDRCIDYLYQNVFSKDVVRDIVAFMGWSVDDTIINFMVN